MPHDRSAESPLDGRAGRLLVGKVAIVTGVGPGLGRATALALAREGAAVALAARTEERVRTVAEEIEAVGGRALAAPTNVADPAQCRALVTATAEVFGGVDVVVNSAFRGPESVRFGDADLAKWRKVLDLNLFGALEVTQAAVPSLRDRGGGSVVMVASMSARKIRPGEGAYAVSKGALLTATRSLAIDLAPDRIRVNAVVPGWMWGPNVQTYVSWQSESRGIDEGHVVAEITREIPLGFVPPQEDVAETIVFLASDRAGSITGQAIDVNGGEWTG